MSAEVRKLRTLMASILRVFQSRLEESHGLRFKSRREANPTKHVRRSPVPYIERLDGSKRDIADITTTLRQFQYRDHEETILTELEHTENTIRNKYAEMSKLELPRITSPSPLRPTTLLDRAIERHRLMKIQKLPAEEFGKLDIINVDGGCSQLKLQLLVKTSERSSLKSKSSSNRKSEHPILRYEHQDGKSRNLPGQPELIRLLFETEPSFARGGAGLDHNDSNHWLDLYGSVEPPIGDRIKHRVRRRRKTVCKFCGKPPGCHQNWCIYYMTEPDLDRSNVHLPRIKTDLEIKPTKSEKSNSSLERSHTTIEGHYLVRPDLPDYSSLHRDVYDHALAMSRARRALRGARDFTSQVTKPFVFSYFGVKDKTKMKGRNGMEHIFGKENVDFTKYYRQFVKERHTTI